MSQFISNKNGIIEPIINQSHILNIQVLAYYKNSLLHAFADEAKIIVALVYLISRQAKQQATLLDELVKEV